MSLSSQCTKGLAEPLRVAAVETCHSLFSHRSITVCVWIQEENDYLWIGEAQQIPYSELTVCASTAPPFLLCNDFIAQVRLYSASLWTCPYHNESYGAIIFTNAPCYPLLHLTGTPSRSVILPQLFRIFI